MEKDDEMKGAGNSLTTEFRLNDPRIGGRWWSLDPKPNPSISRYAGYDNNPVFYSDPRGDSANVDGIYNYDEKTGELKNKIQVKAFELWASTPQGRKTILSYAHEGFKMEGKIIDFSISAEENGTNHNHGMDANFSIQDTKYDGAGEAIGELKKDGRFLINFRVEKDLWAWSAYDNYPDYQLLKIVNTWSHEVNLHGDQWRYFWLEFRELGWEMLNNKKLNDFNKIECFNYFAYIKLHSENWRKGTTYDKHIISILKAAKLKAEIKKFINLNRIKDKPDPDDTVRDHLNEKKKKFESGGYKKKW